MEFSNLLPPIFGAAMAVMGWFIRVLWDASKEVRQDLAKLREELPREFVLREDYRRDIYEIKQLLRDISTKLDSKVDK
jgi:hypothetical protein